MPSTSKKQQRWAWAKLQEAQQGHNETGMTEKQLREFAESRIAGKSKKGKR